MKRSPIERCYPCREVQCPTSGHYKVSSLRHIDYNHLSLHPQTFALPDCVKDCIGLVLEYIPDEGCPTAIYNAIKEDEQFGVAIAKQHVCLPLQSFGLLFPH